MLKSRSSFFLITAIIVLFIVVILDLLDEQFSWHDILVEFHGLIFDLIIFGLILTIYESIRTKKETINRYLEEIDDYRNWYSEEAMYRIKGLINRLIKLNFKKIDLRFCNINACPPIDKMINWNFSGAKLNNCMFIDIDLRDSHFLLSTFCNTCFINSDLSNCNFSSSILNDTTFTKCNLNNTDFLHAYILGSDWIDKLEAGNNQNSVELKDKYIISLDTVEIESIKYFQILDKYDTERKAKTKNELAVKIFDDLDSNISNQLIRIIK